MTIDKTEALLDLLEVAMSECDWYRAEIMLARLSKYYQYLDEKQIDYYNLCQVILEESFVEYYDEPTEYDEWQSYDADC
jgi:anaerobic ribonucleoside-triphosphate reductase